MPIRDIILTTFVLGALPACVLRPHFGVLLWAWFAFMNPHKHTWNFAADFPFAMLIGAATLLGFIISRDKKPFVWSGEILILLCLWAWFTVTTVFAIYPDDAWEYWTRTSKVLLMSLLTIPFFQNRERLRWLLLVVAVSIGYYGARGGLGVFITGGNYPVMGPPGGTGFSSNNAIGLAMNMCMPVFWYLAREEPRRWARYALYATSALTVVAVPFTYSRGAVLGLGVVLCLLVLKANLRYLPLLAGGLVVAAVLLFTIAPEKLVSRVESIQEYEEDGSANARLMAWQVGLQLARDHPVMGGGFWVYNHPAIWEQYAPEEGKHMMFDAHSIYFNLLGEHGVIGLGLFLVLMAIALWNLRRVHRVVRGRPDLQWASRYAHMLEVALIGYLVTGTFMSVAYFDLTYQFLVIAVLVKHLAVQGVRATADGPEAVPQWQPRRLPSSLESA